MSVRLYAVVSMKARLPRSLSGVEKEPLRLIVVAPVELVVSQSRAALDPSAENLRAYHHVIETLASVSDAILPARFNVVSEWHR